MNKAYRIVSNEEWDSQIDEKNLTATKEQQQVMNVRDCDVLVSAAAGSGKTWVLVQRMMKRIKEEKMNVNEFLMVTFTKAAASEMRERIGKEIQKALEKEPENEHLMKQMSLVHKAQISTIHSFCTKVLREHFMKADLDPNFRVADETELVLLQNEALEETMEVFYERLEKGEEEQFRLLTESYIQGKKDTVLENMVMKIAKYANTYRNPKEWLLMALNDQEVSKGLEKELQYSTMLVKELLGMLLRGLVWAEEYKATGYVDTLKADFEQINYARSAMKRQDFNETSRRFATIEFARLSTKGIKKGEDSKELEKVRIIRNIVKERILELKNEVFYCAKEEIETEQAFLKPIMECLIQVVIEYIDRYNEKKRARTIVDFNDLEQLTVQVLTTKTVENGKTILVPSNVAKELGQSFKEIMIDEYQDSNYVQEAILSSMCGEDGPHLFMVGDMKQSIYRFRMARPELFSKKYNTFMDYDEKKQAKEVKIQLDQNFRSRDTVLEGANAIFRLIMRKEVGAISYDKKAELKVGADFGIPYIKQETMKHFEEIQVGGKCKYLFLDKKDADSIDDEDRAELEARLIARQIKEIVNPKNPTFILDTSIKGQSVHQQYRPATYKDIVILMRSANSIGKNYVNTLIEEGIPAYVESKTGYFDTLEVGVLMNLLRVVDNVMVDIPLVAILKAPFVECSDEDLALITLLYRKYGMESGSFYDKMLLYIEEGDNKKLIGKINHFLTLYQKFSRAKQYMSVEQLIWYMLKETNYLYYVKTLPLGEQRIANIHMFLNKAKEYERSNLKGLFQFLRYMEKLRTYDIDFGEVSLLSENENLVRIMTIHKSKGLEFPIVFVSDTTRKFNCNDERGNIILHPDYYIGLTVVDRKKRTKKDSFYKKIIARKIHREMLGEELRILYVAATRAKEQLYFTGVFDDYEKQKSDMEVQAMKTSKEQKATGIAGITYANSISQWLLISLKDKDVAKKIEVEVVLADAILEDKSMEMVEEHFEIQQRLEQLEEYLWENELEEYTYPYEEATRRKGKFSVTEIKHMYQELEEQNEDFIMPIQENESDNQFDKETEKEFERTVPSFIQKESRKSSGTRMGTAVHKLYELIDLHHPITEESVEEVKQQIYNRGLLDEEEMKRFPTKRVLSLFQTDIGKRMIQAEKEGRLYREWQFVMGMPMKELYKDAKEDMMIVQGIIDACFIENDQYYIIDYKTDRVGKDGENELKKKYGIQLQYYKKTIEQLTEKKVAGCYIYSVALEKNIKMDEMGD